MSSILGQNRYLPRKEVFENRSKLELSAIITGILKRNDWSKINEKLLKVFLVHYRAILRMAQVGQITATGNIRLYAIIYHAFRTRLEGTIKVFDILCRFPSQFSQPYLV